MGKVKRKTKNIFRPNEGQETFVSAFGDRVHQVRRKLHMNQTEMSRYLGRANNNAISRLERGDAGAISFDLIEGLVRLAQAAGFTAEWLLTGMKISPSLSIKDIHEALNYSLNWHYIQSIPHGEPPRPGDLKRYAPEGIRVESEEPFRISAIYDPGYSEVDRDELPARWRGRFLPVIGRLSAGEGVGTDEAEAHPPGWADSFIAHEGAPESAFALRVVGESMQPDYAAGDMVLVDGASHVTTGLACVIIDEDGERRARLKEIRRRGRQVSLISLNPAFKPVKVAASKMIAAYSIIAHLPRVIQRPSHESQK